MPSDGAGTLQRGYAVITPETGGLPQSFVVLQRRSNDRLISESLVTGDHATMSRYAIDLRPTLIRHGAIDAHLIVVNSGGETANIAIRLDGQTSRLVLPSGGQMDVGLRAQFGDDAHGVVEVASDLPVTVTARQVVSNMDTQIIETELPALRPGSYFPLVSNGQGIATEFRFANLSSERAEGKLEFVSPDGQPADGTILR